LGVGKWGAFYCEKNGGRKIGENLYCVKSEGCFFWTNLNKSVKSGNRSLRMKSGIGVEIGIGGDIGEKVGMRNFGMGKKGDGKMYRRARNVSYPDYSYISCNILFLRY